MKGKKLHVPRSVIADSGTIMQDVILKCLSIPEFLPDGSAYFAMEEKHEVLNLLEAGVYSSNMDDTEKYPSLNWIQKCRGEYDKNEPIVKDCKWFLAGESSCGTFCFLFPYQFDMYEAVKIWSQTKHQYLIWGPIENSFGNISRVLPKEENEESLAKVLE